MSVALTTKSCVYSSLLYQHITEKEELLNMHHAAFSDMRTWVTDGISTSIAYCNGCFGNICNNVTVSVIQNIKGMSQLDLYLAHLYL